MDHLKRERSRDTSLFVYPSSQTVFKLSQLRFFVRAFIPFLYKFLRNGRAILLLLRFLYVVVNLSRRCSSSKQYIVNDNHKTERTWHTLVLVHTKQEEVGSTNTNLSVVRKLRCLCWRDTLLFIIIFPTFTQQNCKCSLYRFFLRLSIFVLFSSFCASPVSTHSCVEEVFLKGLSIDMTWWAHKMFRERLKRTDCARQQKRWKNIKIYWNYPYLKLWFFDLKIKKGENRQSSQTISKQSLIKTQVG